MINQSLFSATLVVLHCDYRSAWQANKFPKPQLDLMNRAEPVGWRGAGRVINVLIFLNTHTTNIITNISNISLRHLRSVVFERAMLCTIPAHHQPSDRHFQRVTLIRVRMRIFIPHAFLGGGGGPIIGRRINQQTLFDFCSTQSSNAGHSPSLSFRQVGCHWMPRATICLSFKRFQLTEIARIHIVSFYLPKLVYQKLFTEMNLSGQRKTQNKNLLLLPNLIAKSALSFAGKRALSFCKKKDLKFNTGWIDWIDWIEEIKIF